MNARAAAGAPLGVLLIEDSPADSRLLVESLREQVDAGNVVIQTVRRLADALRELKRFRFSCVLLDLGLPDGEGVAHVARIREADPDVAIVVLTGLQDARAAEEAFRLGAQDYLIKGDRLGEELLDFVRSAIDKMQDAHVAGVADAAARADVLGLHFQPWVDLRLARYGGVHCTLADSAAAVDELWSAWCSWEGMAPRRAVLSVRLRGERPDALDALLQRVDRPELPGLQLELGLSAEALRPDAPYADRLRQFRALGVRLWLDGWGEASLTLHELLESQADGLVLSESVTAPVGRGGEDPALRFVRASVALAAGLNLSIAAPGVAMAEQSAHLAALGCLRQCGSFFAQPEPAAALPACWDKGPWGLSAGRSRT